MDLLKGFSLFSGIGGIDLALRDYVRPYLYCEIDPFCQSVLLSHMQKGNLFKAPIWDDIRTLSTNCVSSSSALDIIYGGFPCQDISIARAGKGLAGERSGLFFEIMRLVDVYQPKFLFLENVSAISSRGGLRVVREITERGYDARWCTLSAQEVGAAHKRERWFLLAHSKSERFQERRFTLREETQLSRYHCYHEYEAWDKEPEDKFQMAGMANGLSSRMDTVKALGNAVVPLQARVAFEMLVGLR